VAASIVAAYTVGQALGQPFGGWLGDAWARCSPDYGRPLISVISVGLGVPCVFAFFVRLGAQDRASPNVWG
jgi:MFS family permease